MEGEQEHHRSHVLKDTVIGYCSECFAVFVVVVVCLFVLMFFSPWNPRKNNL